MGQVPAVPHGPHGLVCFLCNSIRCRTLELLRPGRWPVPDGKVVSGARVPRFGKRDGLSRASVKAAAVCSWSGRTLVKRAVPLMSHAQQRPGRSKRRRSPTRKRRRRTR